LKLIRRTTNSAKINIFFAFIICGVVTYLTSFRNIFMNVISSEFLLNYFGVFLGISLSLITFIHSVTREDINGDKAQNVLREMFDELRSDIRFIFKLFVFALILITIERIIIVQMHTFSNTYRWLRICIDYFRNVAMILSLFSMKDVIECVFVLIIR